jgi:hypothetical protein
MAKLILKYINNNMITHGYINTKIYKQQHDYTWLN